MKNKLFGVDLRLPSPQNDRPRPGKGSPKSTPNSSVAEVRRSSITMDHIRPNLGGLRKHGSDKKDKDRSLSKDKSGSKSRKGSVMVEKPAKLSMFMESPPVLMLGPPGQSVGSIISGRLQVTPNIGECILETVAMYLECSTHTKRPVQDRCRECMNVVTDLYEWHFLTKPKIFNAQDGMQELPFSHLIPGKLPATTHGTIGSIDYSLHVKALASDGQTIEFRREIQLRRALFPGQDKNSVRIFPPTELTLNVTLPSIIHPIGEFPVTCRMTGMITKQDSYQTRWRLRKLTWRIEESETMVSPACSKHANKVGGEGKGVQHEHTREIGNEELKQGWKTDFDKGEVEGEFMAAVNPNTKPQCGMQAQNGLKISHNLILELVIAEEWSQNKKPLSATPTGAARVLRTQFSLNVTERAGMGLSWDDEMPPPYEDVPASPPHYLGCSHTTMEDYEGDDLHEDVEQLNLNS